jgi:thiol-disulfide isomerase/thioredoxin
VAYLIFPENGISQRVFNVTIELPEKLAKGVEIEYDNGKDNLRFEFSSKKNMVVVSDSFYSKYASIFISYPDTLHKGRYFQNSFWITDTPSSIIVKDTLIAGDPLQEYKLTNAYAINDMGGRKLHLFDAVERRDFEKYFSAYWGDRLPHTDSNRKSLDKKYEKLAIRELEFIRENSGLYYSFWLFRREIAGNTLWSADSLFRFYDNVFSDRQKNTMEGEEVIRVLEGRMNAKKGKHLVDFNVKDIQGNIVSLNSLRGKYILLDFWASWCAPCIREMPVIRSIRNNYPESKLEIISISLDDSRTAFNRALVENKMNWRQIFGHKELIRDYAIGPIPQIFLIDKFGEIIYSRMEDNDSQLTLLRNLLKEKL